MATLEEQAPLLIEPRTDSHEKEIEYKGHPHRVYIMAVLCFMIMVMDLGASLQIPAVVQILKNDVCWRHYGHDGSTGGYLDCDADTIVNEVALINNIRDSLNVIPGMLLAMPMGILADRIGRRTILRLGIASVLVTETWMRLVCWWWTVLPTRLIWLSVLGSCLGGGAPVASSMVWVIIADITPSQQRANIFYLAVAASLTGSMLASGIGANLVARGYPWLTYTIAYGIMFGGFLLSLIIPETLDRDAISQADRSDPVDARRNPSVSVRERVVARWRAWVASTKFVRKDRNLPLLIGTFYLWSTTWECMVLLIVYVSRKFHTSIGQAAFVTPLIYASNLITLLVLPVLMKMMMDRYHLSVRQKDLLLATVQTFLLMMGMAFIAWAPAHWVLLVGTAFMGFGSSYDVAVRSLATSLVDQSHYGTLYGIIGLVRGIGSVITGPVEAVAFTFHISLPFWMATGLYLTAFVALLAVRLPKQQDTDKEAVGS